MTESTTLAVERRDNLVILTLNRPKAFNSFNREMALALQAELDACAADPTIRAVLLTGRGRAFCAGQDLAELKLDGGPEMKKLLDAHYNPIIRKITALEKPVVAAVNGIAAGAGFNLALVCDIVVASSKASFTQAFSKIGLIPDSGGTWILPRLVGWQRAAGLMMLSDKIRAEQAEQWGLVYRVFDADTFLDDAIALATTLANMPTQGLAFTKRLLQLSSDNDLNTQLDRECEFQVRAGDTDDYKEGVQAFVEKRAPTFKGA